MIFLQKLMTVSSMVVNKVFPFWIHVGTTSNLIYNYPWKIAWRASHFFGKFLTHFDKYHSFFINTCLSSFVTTSKVLQFEITDYSTPSCLLHTYLCIMTFKTTHIPSCSKYQTTKNFQHLNIIMLCKLFLKT